MEGRPPAKIYHFTEEQLRFIKKLRLMAIPIRIVLGLTFFSLVAGGLSRFFSEITGPWFATLFCVMVITERFSQAPDAGGERRDRGSVVFLWIGSGLSYATAIADFYWLDLRWAPWKWSLAWPLAGTALYAAGQTLRVVAIRTLGKFFTISVRRHEGQRVINEGVYRRVRHPAYAGLWLMTLGFVTVFASLAAYVCFVLVGTAAFVYRIRVEEKMLIDTFGDEYRAYMQKTSRLVPWIF